MEALELIREQRKIKEIVSRLEATIPRIRFFGILEKSQWWKDKASSRPWFRREEPKKEYLMIEARNSQIVPTEKIKSQDFAEILFRKIEHLAHRDLMAGRKIRVVIAHGDNPEEAERLKAKLKTTKKADISFISLTDPVTSINACPQSLFVGWIIHPVK